MNNGFVTEGEKYPILFPRKKEQTPSPYMEIKGSMNEAGNLLIPNRADHSLLVELGRD